jgi:hypothetical protein
MTLRTMQWALFAAMAATVPLLFFAFVVGGFLPLLIIALTLTDPAVLLLGGIHLAVYVPILFLTSRLIAKFILARPEHQRRYVFGGLIGALLLLGLAPLYGASHGQIAFSNVYQIYWEGLNLRYVKQVPEDWTRGWSKLYAGQTLYICSGLVPVPGPSRVRQAVFGWQHEPRVANQRTEKIRWGFEPPAQEKQDLDDFVRKEFERVAPRRLGPAGKLAQALRHTLNDTYGVEPWKYGDLSLETVTYYCVSAQYR